METKDIAALTVAIVGLTIGLWQYRQTSNQEFIKPIREEQLRQYVSLTTVAAHLATIPRNTDEWKKAEDEFWKLYYGPLLMVENYDRELDIKPSADVDHSNSSPATVAFAVKRFALCVQDSTCEDKKLRIDSMALAYTCRNSLAISWGYKDDQIIGGIKHLIYFDLEKKRASELRKQPSP